MNNRMREETASFFAEGEAVVAAVSGGADSMALLDCLLHCGKRLDIVVAHLNHCLRGAESDADAAFVEHYCQTREIPCVIRRLDIGKLAKEKKKSLELCGREERYAFFREFGRRIVTAHTLSDRVETLFLSLTRGAGLSGLCSIPRERGEIIRPLLSFSRREIEGYCREYRISYRQDSSNFVADVSRNRVRLQVLPVLKQINPAVEQNVARTISLMEQDADFLEQTAASCYRLVRCSGGLQTKKLAEFHPAIRGRVLFLFLREHQISPTAKQIQRLSRLLEKNGCRISLPGRKTACLRKGFLQIEESEDHISPPSLQWFRCNRDECEHFINNTQNAFFFLLDYDKIKKGVFLCKKAPGDSIQLVRRPAKTLKKLCNEAALPLPVRARLRVLKDEGGIVWAECFGIAQRVAPTENTERFLVIQQERKE